MRIRAAQDDVRIDIQTSKRDSSGTVVKALAGRKPDALRQTPGPPRTQDD
jgi:hypothetical protein